jgi:hypothetical protein
MKWIGILREHWWLLLLFFAIGLLLAFGLRAGGAA